MKEEYRQILKNSSKKRSLFEAITGINPEAFLISSIILFIIAANFGICMYFRTEIFGQDVAFYKAVFSSLFLGIFLIIPEAVILGLLIVFVEYIFVDIPLLCNRKYLPLETEEIRNLPFNEEEFYDFVQSLYGRQFLGTRCLADSKNLRNDIAVMVEKYIRINEINSLDKMPNELREYLGMSELWIKIWNLKGNTVI